MLVPTPLAGQAGPPTGQAGSYLDWVLRYAAGYKYYGLKRVEGFRETLI